jgi:hypothetical protein
MMHTAGNDAKLKIRLSKSSPFEVKMLVEFIRRGISVSINPSDILNMMFFLQSESPRDRLWANIAFIRVY